MSPPLFLIKLISAFFSPETPPSLTGRSRPFDPPLLPLKPFQLGGNHPNCLSFNGPLLAQKPCSFPPFFLGMASPSDFFPPTVPVFFMLPRSQSFFCHCPLFFPTSVATLRNGFADSSGGFVTVHFLPSSPS